MLRGGVVLTAALLQQGSSQLFPPLPGGEVCQVAAKPDAPLDDLLGITCANSSSQSPEACDCHTDLLSGTTWVPMTRTNGSFEYVPEGQWILTSSDGECVALGESNHPLVLSCPPGFYCLGGPVPPRSCGAGDYCPGGTTPAGRRCPTGHFCPIPALPAGPMPCIKGALCPEGSSWPTPCEAGFYCQSGISRPCQRGHWCSFGTESPVPCHMLSLCPEGSSAEIRTTAALLIAAAVGGFSLGARKYATLVQRGLWVFAACLVPVLLLWLLGLAIGDVAVAGWLTLNLFIVSVNWALLQLDTYRPMGPRALLCVSMGATMWALWAVNPPWAMLVGGLLFFASIFWLMSRQDQAVVWMGRVLLLLAFLFLCVAFWWVDRAFFDLVACFLLLVVLLLAGSWRLGGGGKLGGRGFDSRWPPHHDPNESVPRRSRLATQQSGAVAWSAAPWAGPELPPPPPAVGLGERQAEAEPPRPRSQTTGVNFRLDSVSFFLPDGAQLLKGVSMRIEAARQVAVMGPSGGGKSTLLAVLSGRASYGRVGGRLRVSGRAADDLRFLKDVIGFVPQDDILHGELTVEENIRYQASLRMPAGTTSEKVAAQTAKVMSDLSLSSISGSRVGTAELRGVSGGQRKRVSIAMELVTEPLLLFADEPTSGLDSFTSHEVVQSLTTVARYQSTTSVAVIHQPRWETLKLFDDLVLLGAGGCLVYAGPTKDVVAHFTSRLQVEFPPNMNPADRLLDSIQQDPDACADVWREHSPLCQVQDEEPAPASLFHRQRPAFFQGVLIFMDRSMLQNFRAGRAIFINQLLCVGMVLVLCTTLVYERFDKFMMQAAFASLFLMLLHCIAAQRVFGPDLLVTSREARVGGPMVSYLVAKDLAAFFEITLSAVVFTATYGSFSGAHFSFAELFSGSWAFLYSVSGMSYIYSISLSPGAAQMCGVGSSVIAFCMAGAYQPQLPELARMLGGRGWMVPALSPLRWLYGFLITAEAPHLTELSRQIVRDKLQWAGYDLDYLGTCQASLLGRRETDFTLKQEWLAGRAWVCSAAPMLLLGIIFRFLAGLCLLIYVSGETSGWTRFLAQSSLGAWKLLGRLFEVLVCTFLALFLIAEIWVFGLLSFEHIQPPSGASFFADVAHGGWPALVSSIFT